MITVDKEKVRGVLREVSNAMTRIEAEREFIREAIATAHDAHQIEKKHLRKLARVYHKQNFSEEKANAEEFNELYESIVP